MAGEITILSQDQDTITLSVNQEPTATDYTVELDNLPLVPLTAIPVPFTVTLDNLTLGTHLVEIEQFDALGVMVATGQHTFTLVMPPPDPGTITPTPQMVADLVRTRLVEELGNMQQADGSTGDPVDTFTEKTYPTLTQAQRIIDQAVLATVGQVPGSVVQALPESVKHLSALYAAILIEGSYFREQLTDDQVDLYWELYKAGLRGVINTSDSGGGSGGAGANIQVRGSGLVDSVVAVGEGAWQQTAVYPYA